MPQVKTKASTTSTKQSEPTKTLLKKPTATETRDLIAKMLDYESAALARGMNTSSGRFEMLTASERQFYRAELVADYIRLSAGNLGNTQGYYEAALKTFCSKVCDMAIPSHELIGTYLAAVDIVSKEEKVMSLPGLSEAIRRTMIAVLQECVDLLMERAKAA